MASWQKLFQRAHRPRAPLEPGIWVLRPDGRVSKATFADLQGARAEVLGGAADTDWAPTKYGEFAATSVPAYRAVMARTNAVRSAPLLVYKTMPDDMPQPVGPDHPAQQLLSSVNRWWTASDLVAATEMYLSLWVRVIGSWRGLLRAASLVVYGLSVLTRRG